jgi:hypothetical protein
MVVARFEGLKFARSAAARLLPSRGHATLLTVSEAIPGYPAEQLVAALSPPASI